MARDAPAEFVPLFHAAMARAKARPPLEAFIKSLSGPEADACLAAYFDAVSDPAYRYARRDSYGLAVFGQLAFVAVDRGDSLHAVRIGALVQAEKTVWRERFDGLPGGPKKQLLARIGQLERTLTDPQRQVLRLLPGIIRTGNSGALEGAANRGDFAAAHGCLLVYLEASLRYPGDNERSLQVFMGLSVYAIQKGDLAFVRRYRALVAAEGTIWKLRWDALRPYLRDQVEEALRKRPLALQLIEAGRTSGTVPVTQVTPTPDRVRTDALRRDAKAPTAGSRQFVRLFRAYLRSPSAKAAKDALTEYIFARPLAGLRECLAAYVEVSAEYPADDPSSLYIFFGIASRLINLGKGYEALKLDFLRNTPGTVVAARFAALHQREREILEGEITRLADPKRRRVLDEFKLAYFKRYHADPGPRDLHGFAAAGDADLRDAVRSAVSECDRTFRGRDPVDCRNAFDRWADLLQAHPDPLELVTMLNWCRDQQSITPALRSELYWYGVLALLTASLRRYPEVYDGGLSDEEKAYFLDPSLVPQAYRFDFDRRLEYTWWYRAPTNRTPDDPRGRQVPSTTMRDVSRAHLSLLFLAQRLGFTLVPMDEAERIRDRLVRLKADPAKTIADVTIPVNSRFPKAHLQLGDTVGNLYLVWWDRRISRVYVEMQGCGRVLFEVDSYLKLGRLKLDDDTYGEVWRRTRHLLDALPLFFQILGYLPDLVSGGFASLVTSVLTDLAVTAIADEADLSEGETMALSVLSHGFSGHLTSSMIESKGTRVLLDLDDLEELSQNLGRSTVRQAEAAAQPVQRAISGDARALGEGLEGAGSGSRVRGGRAGGLGETGEELGEGGFHGSGARERSGGEPAGREGEPAPRERADVPEGSEVEPGVLDDRKEGSASKRRSDPDEYNRYQGDGRAEPVSGPVESSRGRNSRGKDATSVPRRGGGAKPGRKTRMVSPYDLVSSESEPILEDLTREGWKFEKIPVKQPKGLGGAFQTSVGTDFEWRITSPSKTQFDADFLARNPDGGGLLIGEAKAAGVADPSKSAHIAFWGEKVESLGRATALSLESDGRLTVEIVGNAPEIVGAAEKGTGKEVRSLVAPEAYLNIVDQQLATELMERQGATLEAYYTRRGKAGYRPSHDEVQKLVDRRVKVTDWEWGRVYPDKKPPRGGPKKPPRK